MEKQRITDGPSNILKLEEEFSNFFEDFMYEHGGSPLLGRIYALCLLIDSSIPLLQKDLVKKFNVNPSTISRNLKELEKWRLITRRRDPGVREWNYYVEVNSFIDLILKMFKDHANVLREKRIEIHRIQNYWVQHLSETPEHNKKGKKILQILDILVTWISIVENELELFIQQLRPQFFTLEKEIVQSAKE